MAKIFKYPSMNKQTNLKKYNYALYADNITSCTQECAKNMECNISSRLGRKLMTVKKPTSII